MRCRFKSGTQEQCSNNATHFFTKGGAKCDDHFVKGENVVGKSEVPKSKVSKAKDVSRQGDGGLSDVRLRDVPGSLRVQQKQSESPRKLPRVLAEIGATGEVPEYLWSTFEVEHAVEVLGKLREQVETGALFLAQKQSKGANPWVNCTVCGKQIMNGKWFSKVDRIIDGVMTSIFICGNVCAGRQQWNDTYRREKMAVTP